MTNIPESIGALLSNVDAAALAKSGPPLSSNLFATEATEGARSRWTAARTPAKKKKRPFRLEGDPPGDSESTR